MTEPIKISDALADENNPAHKAAKEIMEKLERGEISMCACMGAMYGEPYCPCEMKRRGFGDAMENNPLRIADNKQFKEYMSKWIVEMNKLEEE